MSPVIHPACRTESILKSMWHFITPASTWESQTSGLFESIVFQPAEIPLNGDEAAFEWNYVNPIVFYRAIEQQFRGADNAIIGADVKWDAFKGVSLYGQLVLDEFSSPTSVPVMAGGRTSCRAGGRKIC